MKGRKGTWFSIGIVVGLTAVTVQAQSFDVTFDFSGVTISSGLVDPTPPPTATGLSFGSFTAVGYSGNPNAAGRFSWVSNPTGGITGDDDFTHFTGGLDLTKYYEVTITPDDLFEVSIDSISFGVRRSGTGIRSFAVRSSVDGFSSNLPATINPANGNLGVGPDNSFRWLFDATGTSADQNGSRVVLGSEHEGLTDPIVFRFYGWHAETASGTFSIDNVEFSGSTMPVPEPGTFALLSLGLIGLVGWNRARI